VSAPTYRPRYLTARDGLSLFYRDYDAGSRANRVPALCLSGLTRNSADFDRLARRLMPSRRVVALDYRGRGLSERAPDASTYDPTVYLDDIRQLMAAAGLHRAVVLGTSLGGLLAMALGVAAPTTVAAVILNDVGPVIEADGLSELRKILSRNEPQPDWPSAIAHLRNVLPDLSLTSDGDWLEFAKATYREDSDGLLRFDWDPRIIQALDTKHSAIPDLWPIFNSLKRVPTLAIRGGRSRVFQAETLDAMRARHPGLETLTLEQVGHAPSLDEPETRKAIDDFLRYL
jgi:pimeloyl-ACP methyl ester carboxylesterase